MSQLEPRTIDFVRRHSPLNSFGMSSKNDDDTSDEEGHIHRKPSMLRNEIVVPSISIETMESETSMTEPLVGKNDELENQATVASNAYDNGIQRIRERFNDRSSQSNSFSDYGQNKVNRHLTHTNSDGQFGRPLKTVYVPQNGNILPKPAVDSLKSASQHQISASNLTPAVLPVNTIVPKAATSHGSPALLKEPSKKIIEDKMEKSKETDPLFEVTKPIDTWAVMREALSFIIPHSSVSFKFWKIFINLLHLFNLVVAPVLFGWYIHFMSLGWITIFLCLDILFLVDCYLRAHTSFVDEYGIQITHVSATTRRYLFTEWGLIHLISSLPFDLFFFASSWEYVSFVLIL